MRQCEGTLKSILAPSAKPRGCQDWVPGSCRAADRHVVYEAAAFLIVVSPAVASSIAHAAVNACMPLMKPDPAEDSTVTIAKRLAPAIGLGAQPCSVSSTLDGVSSGITSLSAGPVALGTVVCQAGHPCAVRQVPPDGGISLRPGNLQRANPEQTAWPTPGTR